MALSYARYRPGTDDADVLALRGEVWGAGHPHTDARFLQWLYRQNPIGVGTGVILRADGRPIGFGGLVPRLLMRDGRSVRVAQGLEYMVSPSTRGGLAGRYAYKLAKLWERTAIELGYSFAFNLPNANSTRILTSSIVGWQKVLTPALFLRVLPAFKATDRVGGAPPLVATAIGRAVSAWCSLRRGRSAPPCGAPTRLACHDERLDELWAVAARSVLVGTCRTSAYLDWRYGQHPLYRYELYGWEQSGRITAYLVAVRRTIFGVASMLITDILAAPGQEGAMIALLDFLAAECRASDIHVLGTQASVPSYAADVLREAGFVSVPSRANPKQFILVTLGLADPSGLENDPRSWYFTWGDADVV